MAQAEAKTDVMKLFLSSVIVCLCALILTMKMRLDSSSPIPQWMEEAAAHTVQALQIPCSGHGRVFESSLGSACECNPCFTGPDCSQEVVDCVVDADGGDPTFLEDFWRQQGAAAGIFIPSWYRLSYSASSAGGTPLSVAVPVEFVTQDLDNRIRQLHELVGNAVTKNRYLVVGTGSMQLVAAAVTALSDSIAEKPASVVSRAPYYMIYKMQMEMLASTKFNWHGDAVKAAEAGVDASLVIELVASPNNPDTVIQDAVFKGTNAKIIFDKAYYWPHFTPITEAVDEDIVLFSLSKCTGHAGSRIGWAIVKDVEIYKKMMFYITVTTIGVSQESQLRAAKIIQTITETYSSGSRNGPQVFHYAYQLMQARWQSVSRVFENSTRFSLQEVRPQHCLFFDDSILPSPAYAWIKCEQQADCVSLFRAAGIIGRPGRAFGVEDSFIRLTLIKRDDHFDHLIRQLKLLDGILKI